jgi:hypothetical protein
MVAKIKGTESGILCPVVGLGISIVKHGKEGRKEGTKEANWKRLEAENMIEFIK